MYHQVRLGESGIETVNLALAYPKKAMQRGLDGFHHRATASRSS